MKAAENENRGMRFVKCPDCGADLDITKKSNGKPEKYWLASLLSGEFYLITCKPCDKLVRFRLEGRCVVQPY